MIITKILILNLVFIASAYSKSSDSARPENDQKLNKLTYDVVEEWNIVPDSDGGWSMIHKSELMSPDKYETLFTPETDISFLLYTKKNNIAVRILLDNDASFHASGFNRSLPVRFVIHGFQNDASSEINQILPKAYREIGEYNIIVVDWGLGGNLWTIEYPIARWRVRSVAEIVARFINFLARVAQIGPEQITLVGHSLGAHVAGIAGKSVNIGKLSSIVGLDPARPLFFQGMPHDRIDATDASYVAIIHTDGGYLGIWYPTGNIDIYPNGGSAQPGCGWDFFGTCAHSRSYQYFAESIGSEFYATPCSMNTVEYGDCGYRGRPILIKGEPSKYATPIYGIYYLTTNSAPPFSKGASTSDITIKDIEKQCITAMKEQIQMKIQASIVYLAMGAHFLRDTINRPGFTKKFFKYANEERDHVIILISYLLMDGELTGQMKSKININVTDLINIHPVSKTEWSNGFNAFYDASKIEVKLSKSNKMLIYQCKRTGVFDDQVLDYLNEYRKQQYHKQREITEIYLTLGKMNKGLVGEFLYDKTLLRNNK